MTSRESVGASLRSASNPLSVRLLRAEGLDSLLSSFAEEVPHQITALLLADARDHLDVVIHTQSLEAQEAFHGTPLGFPGAVDHTAHSCVNQRSGAHEAGLQRNYQSGTGQTVVGELSRGLAEDDYLGVGGWVLRRDGLVEARSDHSTRGIQKHRADRNLIGHLGEAGLGDGEAHRLVKIDSQNPHLA